ncbi:hypothetical protein ACVII0_005975 [Sinorhizobium meliloti]
MRTLPATTASGSALPFWLPSTRTFSGTPTSADVGTIAVLGTASDLGSLAASETFNITVSTTPNGAPTAVPVRATPPRSAALSTAPAARRPLETCSPTTPIRMPATQRPSPSVSFNGTAGTLGTALTGDNGSVVLNASGTFTYTVNEGDAAVQALRQSTQHDHRPLQLHDATRPAPPSRRR